MPAVSSVWPPPSAIFMKTGVDRLTPSSTGKLTLVIERLTVPIPYSLVCNVKPWLAGLYCWTLKQICPKNLGPAHLFRTQLVRVGQYRNLFLAKKRG